MLFFNVPRTFLLLIILQKFSVEVQKALTTPYVIVIGIRKKSIVPTTVEKRDLLILPFV